MPRALYQNVRNVRSDALYVLDIEPVLRAFGPNRFELLAEKIAIGRPALLNNLCAIPSRYLREEPLPLFAFADPQWPQKEHRPACRRGHKSREVARVVS